jgi:hypothetical protein
MDLDGSGRRPPRPRSQAALDLLGRTGPAPTQPNTPRRTVRVGPAGTPLGGSVPARPPKSWFSRRTCVS